MKKNSGKLKAFITASIVAGLLTGCGNAGSKTVSTDGSTSMEKVIGYLSEAYMNSNDIKVTYNPTGSSAGIQAAAEGRCDIGLSSRHLKDDEKKNLSETTLAIDGIAIIVNPENKVSELTVDEIAALYTGEITNWKELGGNDTPVVCIGREAASGTRDGFESVTGTANKCVYSQELTSTGDVIQTVSSNPNAVGYASVASVKDNVRMVSVDGVIPSESTILSGEYKIQRDFVLVTRTDKKLSDEAQSFYDFCMSSKAAEYITKAGAYPIAK